MIGADCKTLADLLQKAAETFPDQEVYVAGGRRMTYAQLFDHAARLATGLREKGLKAGDVLLISMHPSVDYPTVLAAGVLLGAVVSGVNPRLGAGEIQDIVDRSRATVVALEDDAPAFERISIVRRGELADLIATRPALTDIHKGEPSDPAIIIWTSGTTGAAKGAWYDHAGMKAASLVSGLLSDPYEHKLMGTPLVHAGFMGKVWEQWAYALTLVMTPTPWNARDMLRLMVDEKINIVGGAPTQWEKLIALPEAKATPFPHLRVGVAAMAPATPELVRAVTETLGVSLISRYSMTEITTVTGTDPDDSPEVKFRTVGRPQAHVEMMLIDAEGREVPQGEIGRVKARSPHQMRGYWCDPERTAEVMSDGWILSNDLGKLDPDGNLVLTGRTTEMYIRGGYNIYPIEVERVLADHPKVGSVAVVGLKTAVIGEIGVAFVVPRDAAQPPTLEELRDFTKGKLADYKAPDRLIVLDALPQTAMMKIDKLALKATAEATPAPPR